MNADFMRAAGADLEVWQATDEDLADLDIGSAFASEFAEQRVPTLRQVLDLAFGGSAILASTGASACASWNATCSKARPAVSRSVRQQGLSPAVLVPLPRF